MKIIENLEQGSKEWLEMRLNHVTATDAAIIMNVNPWKSPLNLWRQKLLIDPPEPLNEKMKRGQDLEPEARNLLIENTGIDFKPVVCVHDVDTWCMASLDGISETRRVICEIKCPNDRVHMECQDEIIPPYYEAQIQHQLYVTGADYCIYCTYAPQHVESMATIEVYPEPSYIEHMIKKERIFYEKHMCGMLEPGWTLKKKDQEIQKEINEYKKIDKNWKKQAPYFLYTEQDQCEIATKIMLIQ